MKNLELEGFGLVEMREEEMVNTDGGAFFGALLGFVVGVALYYIIGEPTVNEEPTTAFAFGLLGAAFGATLPF